jgi:hypothetical protein
MRHMVWDWRGIAFVKYRPRKEEEGQTVILHQGQYVSAITVQDTSSPELSFLLR